MNKEFIPYEQALELKELGFNENCFASYTYDRSNEGVMAFDIKEQNGLRWSTNTNEQCKQYKEPCTAPTFSQAFRWFREKLITDLVVNDKGDTIQGMFTLLPLIYLNSYEIHVIRATTSYFTNHPTGENIPFYGAARHKYHAYSPSYEEAELACIKKLIEIAKNR